MSVSVVTGINAPPVFEFSKHIFDFMAQAVECFVEGDYGFSIGFWWNTQRDAVDHQGLTKPVSVITLITQ